MARRVSRYETTALSASRARSLWVRPTFRVRGETLLREPARDYATFVETQREIIESEFDGGRSRRRATSVVAHFHRELRKRAGWDVPESVRARHARYSSKDFVGVNTAIILELANEVQLTGAKLTIVDAFEYFDPQTAELSEAIRELCEQHGIGFVSLSQRLLAANARGVATRWRYDGHFNEASNELFAEAMFEALSAE
jgi:hypothetical protein